MGNDSYADAAITAYRSALDVRRTQPDRRQFGDTENHLAIVYQQMYRKTRLEKHAREAEAGFQRALDLCDSIMDPLGWARIRNNLGLLYADMYLHTGDNSYAEEALRAYDDALTKFRNEDDPSTWAGIQSNRALLFAYKYRHSPEDRYAQASVDAYQQVLRMFSPESAPAHVTATAPSFISILNIGRRRMTRSQLHCAQRTIYILRRRVDRNVADTWPNTRVSACGMHVAFCIWAIRQQPGVRWKRAAPSSYLKPLG